MSKMNMMDSTWKNVLDLLVSKIFSNRQIVFFICFCSILLILNGYVLAVIGPSHYLESFKHPSEYFSGIVKSDDIQEGITLNQKCIIQKTSHPDFTLSLNDVVYVTTVQGEKKVVSIDTLLDPFQYESCSTVEEIEIQLLNNQEKIIGKIISYQDNNPLELLSFSYWMLCKDIMNVHQLFNQHEEL